ncbi:MAG: YfhO family protein [marine benthic group bacterium]|nr:YfhO family protein [Gemmatimonadota bacterium]
MTRQMPPGDSARDPSGERNPLTVPLAIALLTAASLVLFWPVLFGGRTLFGRDITPFFYPMKHVLVESIRAGRIPWWNPGLVNGEPFFAALQPGVLYPGSLLLYTLPLSTSFDWLVALHYPIAGAGLLLLLRRWGRSLQAAWLGAAAFMLGGYLVSLGNFPNNLQTVAWVPWLFWSWDRVLTNASSRRIAAFAALCATAFLGGEPQLLAIGLIWLFVHGALNIEERSVGLVRQTGSLAVAGAVAVAVVAAQLVPFVEFILHSVRTMPTDIGYATSRSLEPTGLVHLGIPPVLATGVHGYSTRFIFAMNTPWVLSPYLGAVVLGLALFGIRHGTGRTAWFWSVSAMIGILIALGATSPVYRFLFETVPLLRPFRYPEKFLLLPAMAIAVLAASGADRAGKGKGRRAGVILFGCLALLHGVTAIALRWTPGVIEWACASLPSGLAPCEDPGLSASLYASQAVRLTVLLGLTTAVVGVGGRGRLRPEAVIGLLAMLVVADLVAANARINPSVESEVYDTPAWPALALETLGADPQAYRFRGSPHDAAMGNMVRVDGAYELSNLYLDFETMGPNVGQLYGWQLQDGLQGIELRSVALTNDAAIQGWGDDPIDFLRAMNVRWYADPTVAADTLVGLRVAGRHPDLPLRLFEVPNPLPRAYLVSDYELAEGPARALARTLQSDFPLGERVVLERPPTPRAMAGMGRILSAEFGQNRVRFRTSTSGPMLLVLNDRYYPGWKARVDGIEVPVLRAGGVFRAISLPSGDSEVELRFRPTAFGLSVAVSLVGLLALLGLATWRPGRTR